MLKHIVEFVKNEIDTHPQLGCSQPKTWVNIYFYEYHFEIWGYGTLDRFKANFSAETIEMVTNEMLRQGFSIPTETDN